MRPSSKNWIYTLSLCAFGLNSPFAIAKTAAPKTDVEKVSYAIGQQIGKSLKSQNIEIKDEFFTKGVTDQIEGKKPLMTPQEVEETMMKMQQQMMAKMQKKAEENKTAGSEYLAKNKKQKGVITTKSGLQYKVLKSGKGSTPKATSKVKVHYEGKLLDGTVFDSSIARKEPAEFPVGGVIPGWTEALKLMKEGDSWELTIPSDLAYGAQGNQSIPPNSVLKFKVELIKVL